MENQQGSNPTYTQPPSSSARTDLVKFHGATGDYYKIWIVNLLLTIVTLGIYSAWAKVRKLSYFYGNTEVDSHRFSYLANPLNILKGRIIALALFAIFYFSSAISPIISLVFALIYIFAMPYILCRSLKFQLQMTAYRNIRFNFHGQYGQAFLTFMLYPILALFTFYLAMPWVLKKIDQFIVDNTSFGNKTFTSNLSTATYYKASILAVIVAIAIFSLFMFSVGVSFSALLKPEHGVSPYLSGLLFATYLGAFVVSGAIYTTTIRNHLFNNSEISNVAHFKSSITFPSLLTLRITNLLLIICTLGLAIPWVMVRNAQYMSSKTEVTILPAIENIVADGDSITSATGEEIADTFDFDIALG
jgi:uncharacterized membrane protein YjgN (DUF898 family)